jgi:hypothetical protein
MDPQPDHVYTIGVDVAEGVGGCASVAQVFDITDLTNIHQAACYHNATVDPYHFAEYLNKLGHQWGLPPLLIERNGPGGQVIDALKEVHHYYNLVEYNPESQKNSGRLGIFSHTNSKNKAITNMRYWINSMRAVNIYDIATIHEMETFVRYANGTWKKKPGNFVYDDRVHGMLWALFVLDEELVSKYFNVEEYDSRGKPLRIKATEVIPAEYYRLDPFYNDNDVPLPVHFNEDPASDDKSTKDELMEAGWFEWKDMG